jgi:hypothetical protein
MVSEAGVVYCAPDMRSLKLVVLVVCAAPVAASCGDDSSSNGHLADAPPGGGSGSAIDAPSGTGTPPPVTLTVTVDGAPVPGVHTYFLNPDDSVAATVDTDASGTATAKLPDGGTVTAIDPFVPPVQAVLRAFAAAPVIGNNELRTFAGVKPGDHLVLDRNDRAHTVVVRLPQSEPIPNQYQVTTPCGSFSVSPFGNGSGSGSGGSPSSQLTLVGCADKIDIAVAAIVNDTAVSAFVHAGADLTGGLVDLTDDTYAAATTRTFAYPNAPDIQITTAQSLVATTGVFGPFGQISGPEVTIGEPVIAGATGITDVSVQLNGTHHLVDAGALAATSSTDLTGQLLPDFNGGATYNSTNKLVTWLEDTTNQPTLHGATADLSLTRITVNRGERNWQWSVAAPYAPGKVAFPTLPNDLADWMPNFETDDIQVAELISAKLPGGYDAARAHIFDLHDSITNDSFAGLAVGVTGRVVAAVLGRNQPTITGTGTGTVRQTTAAAAAKKLRK